MIFGYLRTSVGGGRLQDEVLTLESFGARRIIVDQCAAQDGRFPRRDSMLKSLAQGDTVVVTHTSHFADDPRKLSELVGLIHRRGASFRSLSEYIDTATPAGRLILHVLSASDDFDV